MLLAPYFLQVGEIGATGVNITQILLPTGTNDKIDFLKHLAAVPG